MAYFGLLCGTFLFAMGCAKKTSEDNTSNEELSFYKVGHRGTRGLVPENTIPSMIKALEVGANTLEFDVHVSKDRKVIVYHDASANPTYTRLPNKEITNANRKEFTFYQMNYDQIRQFQVVKNSKSYPDQQKMTSNIPLMTMLIDSVESYTDEHKMPPAHYLLEIKSNPAMDGVGQPKPEEYVSILMNELQPRLKALGDRLIIQSFDERLLQVIHKKYPDIILGFLTGNQGKSFEQNIQSLGFIPAFYNPHYTLVTRELLGKCHNKNIRVCPWTVNKKEEIKKLKEMGVDGIITDYPNYF